ncbi:MAG: S8 family serine peptidase [Anaerolineae bacterium]|nr:S8 family serine peptidase [Anaerolineae bacterium]
MLTRFSQFDRTRRLRGLARLIILSLLLTGLPAGAAPPAPGDGSHFVRISDFAVSEVTALGLSPQAAINYGSFRWLQLNAADLARLRASGLPFTVDEDAGKVQVRDFVFDPLAVGEPNLPEAMQTLDTGPALRLVQFAGPIQDAWLADLAAAGLKPLQYYPSNTYLVWGTATQAEAAATQPFVRWQGAFHPAYKLNADLHNRRGRIENVDVMFYNDGQPDQTLAALAKFGAQLVQVFPSQPDRAFFDAIVTLDADALTAVSQLGAVLAVAYASPQPQVQDEAADQILAGNYAAGRPFPGYRAWLADLGFDGRGVTWAVIDTGVDYDHPDFSGRIVGGADFPGACSIPGQPGSDCAGGGHGTHVAGSIASSGAGGFGNAQGFLYGLGVAPGANIFAMNPLSGNVWPPAGGWQEMSRLAILGGAVGGSSAWTSGEGINHGYQATERIHDFIVLDGNFDTPTIAEPFVEVFPSGNSGYLANTLTAPAEAKNLIVAASSVNPLFGWGDDMNATSEFSSRGPTVDGRYGPTLAAPGENIASTRNHLGGDCSTAILGANNLYAYCSGASMAAGHTSGALALLTQWWRSFNAGANPSPAMATALLVNGAVDMGSGAIPNVLQGWGRINLTNVISSGLAMVYHDQSTVLRDTGEFWEVTVGVPDPTRPLKVTLAWSDAPGAVGANPALVNDLNLTVTDDAVTYKGNVFDHGWSVSGGAADARNNLENVYLRTHGETATIRVEAANLPGDAVLYNGDATDQGFALVCANCTVRPDFTLAGFPTRQSVCAPISVAYTLTVGAILGFDQPVSLSASGAPAGVMVGFSGNPVTPPVTPTLTLCNTAAAPPGAYSINVVGMAVSATHTTTVGLDVFDAAPAAPGLLAPADGAPLQPRRPTFTWDAASQAQTYAIEIAFDASFSTIVAAASGLTSASFTPASDLLTSTRYYWRVQAFNTCGAGATSAVFSFTTLNIPGACGPGTAPVTQVMHDFDGPHAADGWTAVTVSGPNQWGLATNRWHSPPQYWHAGAPAAVSEVHLISPRFSLPSGQAPLTLQFWNSQIFEDGTAGCYDGALLEITTDDGVTWAQAPNEMLLTQPYNGVISSDFDNPLAGRLAWCGDQWEYLHNIVDLNAFAGQTVRFRFRVGTDRTVGRPSGGWEIDDLAVQSCQSQVRYFPLAP